MPQTDSKHSGADPDEINRTFAQAARRRPAMWVGSIGGQGLSHLVYLAMTEAVVGIDLLKHPPAPGERASCVDVTLHTDNSVTVSDNGRGFPVAKLTGKDAEREGSDEPWPQKILTSTFVPAQNGAAIVNAFSRQFQVTMWRDGGVWEQSYREGDPISEVRPLGDTKKHGTSFHFLPDPAIFSVHRYDVELLTPLINKFLSEYPDVVVTLTDEREVDPATGNPRSFQFKNRELTKTGLDYHHSRERTATEQAPWLEGVSDLQYWNGIGPRWQRWRAPGKVMRLREIKALGDQKYEVTLEDLAGGTERAVCTLVYTEGISAMQMQPDLFTRQEDPIEIDIRELTKAVFDYHHQLLEEKRRKQGNKGPA
jgi:hypothetical protein